MSGKTYDRPKRNQWVQPCNKSYKLACCDCGLVHEVDFRVVKWAGGTRTKAQFRMRRNNRSTAMMRRMNRIKVT